MVSVVWHSNGVNSYLENRKQFVSFDKYNSDMQNISYGVPQSSILSPKIVILYINDMCNISNVVKFTSSLQMILIFYHANSHISRLNERICCELEKLYVWFAVNKLTVNITKTNYMLFGSRVRVTQFLGVFIDMNF